MEQNQQALNSLEPKPRGGKGLLIAAIAAVAVLCAVGGVFAMRMLGGTPEQQVADAFQETFAQAGQEIESLRKDYPALAATQSFASPASAAMDYRIGFAGIEGIDYANMISAFLSGSSIDLSVAQDLESHAADMEMGLTLLGETFLEGRYHLSPETIVLSVPTLSETAVSIRPEGFAEAYPASPLGQLYPADEQQLALIQEQLDACTAQLRMADPQMAETLESGLREIGTRLAGEAAFSKPEKDRYHIEAPGEAVRQALTDALRLCVSACYSDEMLDSMAGTEGASLREQLEELYESIPPLALSADLTVSNRIVTAVAATLSAPPEETSGDAALEALSLNYSRGENGSHTFAFSSSGGEADGFTLRADYAGAEAEDRYQERLTLTAGLQDDDELFRLTWDYSTGKDGTLRHEGSFAVPGDQISVGFTADGALTRDGETVSVDLPGTRIAVSAPSLPQEAAVLLDIGFSFHPLGEALTPPEASDLLSMSEEKLNALYQEAEGNLNGLAGRFYSLMLG